MPVTFPLPRDVMRHRGSGDGNNAGHDRNSGAAGRSVGLCTALVYFVAETGARLLARVRCHAGRFCECAGRWPPASARSGCARLCLLAGGALPALGGKCNRTTVPNSQRVSTPTTTTIRQKRVIVTPTSQLDVQKAFAAAFQPQGVTTRWRALLRGGRRPQLAPWCSTYVSYLGASTTTSPPGGSHFTPRDWRHAGVGRGRRASHSAPTVGVAGRAGRQAGREIRHAVLCDQLTSRRRWCCQHLSGHRVHRPRPVLGVARWRWRQLQRDNLADLRDPSGTSTSYEPQFSVRTQVLVGWQNWLQAPTRAAGLGRCHVDPLGTHCRIDLPGRVGRPRGEAAVRRRAKHRKPRSASGPGQISRPSASTSRWVVCRRIDPVTHDDPPATARESHDAFPRSGPHVGVMHRRRARVPPGARLPWRRQSALVQCLRKSEHPAPSGSD